MNRTLLEAMNQQGPIIGNLCNLAVLLERKGVYHGTELSEIAAEQVRRDNQGLTVVGNPEERLPGVSGDASEGGTVPSTAVCKGTGLHSVREASSNVYPITNAGKTEAPNVSRLQQD